MIQISNLSYTFAKGGGVSNIDMSMKDDEFAFLIGPTGSGKTTLLRLIYMDLLPQVGNIIIGDYDSDGIKQKQIALMRRKVGMVFQDYHLLSDRNLFENVALPLHVIGYSKDEIVDRVKDSLEEVGLDGKENHFPSELSGGEQQRACVARAMIKEPDVILADEPTGYLDPVTSFELIKFFEEINREGTAILMASHNYNLIKGRGHRIIEIRNGSIRRS